MENKPVAVEDLLKGLLKHIANSPEPKEPPFTVNKITYSGEPFHPYGIGVKCGDFVSVRPCDAKYENKTYLGVYIGEVALAVDYQYEDGELKIFRHRHNPQIYIPDTNTVVFGCESWWGKIKTVDQLHQITDDDIQNIWYVKALKALNE